MKHKNRHDPIDRPTLSRLKTAARRYLELSPWQWMFESDLFGVENPETGEVGYCSVLGRNSATPGLALYRGDIGLMEYEYRQAQELGDPFLENSPGQNALLLRFHPRKRQTHREISPEERLLLDGRPVLPVFFDLQPGYLPVMLEHAPQARWLIHALEQTTIVASSLHDNRDLLDHIEAGNAKLLVRRPTARPEGGWSWKTQWVPQIDFSSLKRPVEVNQLYLRSHCRALPKQKNRWLVDVFFLSQPELGPDGVGYYPQVAH
ncbi:MAG: hypothetical protein D6722_09400, partial [Bacteroidetes bacterium]